MISLFRRGLLACALLVLVGTQSTASRAGEPDTYLYFQLVEIQGQSMNLMVDTGATFTILKKSDMDRIPDKRSLGPTHMTLANGVQVEMMQYSIPQMRIGRCLLANVRVIESPQAVYSLLGMQTLTQLEPFSFSRGMLSVTCPTQ